MIYNEKNNEINLEIAFELAKKRFHIIEDDELKNNTAIIAKDYKKYIINIIKELEKYDTENGILDYIPSI